MTWLPHITVASVIEKNNKFLLIEEMIDGRAVLNQPAGHWEQGESLVEAVTRETLEESAWHFTPESLIGIYSWQHPKKSKTYLRFAFCGEAHHFEENRPLDEGIIGTSWLTAEEIKALAVKHRSPQVQRCIDDYLSGQRFPLHCLAHVA